MSALTLIQKERKTLFYNSKGNITILRPFQARVLDIHNASDIAVIRKTGTRVTKAALELELQDRLTNESESAIRGVASRVYSILNSLQVGDVTVKDIRKDVTCHHAYFRLFANGLEIKFTISYHIAMTEIEIMSRHYIPIMDAEDFAIFVKKQALVLEYVEMLQKTFQQDLT